MCTALSHLLIFNCKRKCKTFILELVDLLILNIQPKYATYGHWNGLAATGLQLFLVKKRQFFSIKIVS